MSSPANRFDFWHSMRELGRLVLRSGAPGLAWRIPLALGLVFGGKLAGVWGPVMLGCDQHPADGCPGGRQSQS